MAADDPHFAQAKLAVIVLAAGLGTRMKSRTPKELQPLLGRTMLDYVLAAAEIPLITQRIVVLSPAKSGIAERLPAGVDVAWQDEQLGTGHASACGLELVAPDVTHVAVLFGDHPLLQRQAIDSLAEMAVESDALVTLLTTIVEDPGGYGRIRRDAGRISRIVEARDDHVRHEGPVEIYSGISCYRRDWLDSAIQKVPRSESGEYYLTSLVELAVENGAMSVPVVAVQADPSVAYGVNDRVDLARAEGILRERILKRLMRDGVTVVDPASTFIDDTVTIGMDSHIEPFTIIRGDTRIGEDAVIGPSSVVIDSVVGDHSQIISSRLTSARVGTDVEIGPFSHLRAGAVVENEAHIGNYVEIKNSTIGRLTRVGHFSYIGDTTIGEDTNIGAGTVTCNYDGANKHQTEIGSRVFIGSDTMLVAPVRIGDGAATGAGSVVTKDVPPGELVAGVPARSRERQQRRGRNATGQGEVDI